MAHLLRQTARAVASPRLSRAFNIMRDTGTNYKLKTFNAISPVGLEKYPRDKYEVSSECTDAKAIMLRSHKLQVEEVEPTVRAVARCGAGVNNIPIDTMTEMGVCVFNTPGANANAVKELVLCGMLLCARDVAGGAAWSRSHTETDPAKLAKDVESAKKQFGGMEIAGKTLGVIGLGNIGRMVVEAAAALGMNCVVYDPHLTIDQAFHMDSAHTDRVDSVQGVVSRADFLSIHVPFIAGVTENIVSADMVALMKTGAHVLNFSRGGLIDEDALMARFEADGAAGGRYCTDFPSVQFKEHANVISLPHLGASTAEAEEQSAAMAAVQLRDFLENGSIKNSVNFPECIVAPKQQGHQRLCIVNRNMEGTLSNITAVISCLNVAEMVNKSQGDVAYTVIDIEGEVSDEAILKIGEDTEVLNVRVIS